MTALPRLYTRFLPLFSKMDLPLRNALEGLLTEFAKVPPPYTSDERKPEGEFVGYDGIENRGKLANLLESEWLLRELDPDDFVRRVAESEVMFRRRDFKGTGTKDVMGVVLDCGPWMLGRNRIVALAALFYLALRADRMGAQLMWMVPGYSEKWSQDLTQDNIRIFLGRIVQEKLTHATIDTALMQLEDASPKECWYVGATQTEQLVQHPAITGGILVNTPFGDDEAQVQITSRGRRSRLSVTLPSDPDTIAALRRPFVPERKKIAKTVTNVGKLSAFPFYSDWLLDRFNHAVLIRYPNGMLWQPLRNKVKGIWLTTSKDKILLGVQPQANGQIAILNRLSDIEVELIHIDVTQNPAELVKRIEGRLYAPVGGQPKQAMGNLHLGMGADCLLVTDDGTIHNVAFNDTSIAPSIYDQAILSTGVYLIEHNNGALRVKNPKRGTLARINLPSEYEGLLSNPRQLVFSPDTKAITFTTDERNYTALVGLDVLNFEMDDMTLLHFHSASKAIAWNSEDNTLVQFRLQNSKVKVEKVTACDTAVHGVPRYCPLTMTTFAMNSETANEPEMFIPIETKRGWQDVEAFYIPRAIDEAETLCL